MKTEFPILNISPTQWVLVDKTRIPLDLEPYLSWDTGTPTLHIPKGYHDNEYCVGIETPILAAYPKIEGVLLLPSLLWEKKNAHELAKLAYPLGESKPYLEQMASMRVGFIEGYQAAGGYTREDMWRAYTMGFDTNGTEAMFIEGFVEKEFEKDMATIDNIKSRSPRALEIDVNEDGSIPSDNGTITYIEAIY